MMIDRIFLDLDGVLADWTSSAIRACGREPDEVYATWPTGVYELPEALGISANAMWRAVHARGEAFWASLEPFPWADDLWALCNRFAPTTILTSPSDAPCSHSGKAIWLRRHFGPKFRRYLIGSPKDQCASPGAVLIDDRPIGCDAFEAAGGEAVLFPQIWNPVGRVADPVAHVRDALTRLAASE